MITFLFCVGINITGVLAFLNQHVFFFFLPHNVNKSKYKYLEKEMSRSFKLIIYIRLIKKDSFMTILKFRLILENN